MSDTPETDAQTLVHSVTGLSLYCVSADFARKLERERDELRAMLEAKWHEQDPPLITMMQERDEALLELGATQAAVAEALGLTLTPQSADEVRQALTGAVGLSMALVKTIDQLKAERDEARAKALEAAK